MMKCRIDWTSAKTNIYIRLSPSSSWLLCYRVLGTMIRSITFDIHRVQCVMCVIWLFYMFCSFHQSTLSITLRHERIIKFDCDAKRAQQNAWKIQQEKSTYTQWMMWTERKTARILVRVVYEIGEEQLRQLFDCSMQFRCMSWRTYSPGTPRMNSVIKKRKE